MIGPDLRAAALELVERSTSAQGLKPTITDPDALRRVAGILAERGSVRGSNPPDRSDPTRSRTNTAGVIDSA